MLPKAFAKLSFPICYTGEQSKSWRPVGGYALHDSFCCLPLDILCSVSNNTLQTGDHFSCSCKSKGRIMFMILDEILTTLRVLVVTKLLRHGQSLFPLVRHPIFFHQFCEDLVNKKSIYCLPLSMERQWFHWFLFPNIIHRSIIDMHKL